MNTIFTKWMAQNPTSLGSRIHEPKGSKETEPGLGSYEALQQTQ